MSYGRQKSTIQNLTEIHYWRNNKLQSEHAINFPKYGQTSPCYSLLSHFFFVWCVIDVISNVRLLVAYSSVCEKIRIAQILVASYKHRTINAMSDSTRTKKQEVILPRELQVGHAKGRKPKQNQTIRLSSPMTNVLS